MHLLAFIASQTFRYQDVVVDSFLQTVQNITNSATQELREKLFRERKQRRSELRSFVQTIQTDIFQPFLIVDQIVASDELPPNEKLSEIKTILLDFPESRQAIERQISEMLEDSDIHSTDSHGFTEVVFAVTHLLGFTFAPRLKTLCKHQLYSFEKRKTYTKKDFSILPDASINTKLIEENWDQVLRFVATIKLKRTTASQLFKRLNSYSNKHPLYQALKEFGKIIKTLFILNYVDDVELRQSIEKQLSKIEQSQKFAKAIAFGNNQEFSEGDKQMQDIIANSRRLIENMIICWNYLCLTQKLTDLTDENEKQELLETFKNSSIITWQHINFHGEYDFSQEKTKDSIGFNLPKILSWKLEENGK